MDFSKSTGRNSFTPFLTQNRPSAAVKFFNRPSGAGIGTVQRHSGFNPQRNNVFQAARGSRPSGGRLSFAGAGTAAPSSVKRPGAKQQARFEKDPRPITTKAYKTEVIKRIKDYLHNVEVDVPFNLDEINLQAGNRKTVILLFTFFYQKLHPEWHPPESKDSFDQEFMNIFSSMRYPYSLVKSQMMTMTAPHIWPHVLAAFDWLLFLVQVDEEVNQSSFLHDTSSNKSKASDGIAEYTYFMTCFKKQKKAHEGDPLDFSHELQLFRNLVMSEEDMQAETEIRELRAQTEAHNEDAAKLLEDLSQEHQTIKGHEAEEKTYQGDMAKLEEFTVNAKEQISVCSDDTQRLLAEMRKLKDDLAQTLEDNAAKMKIISEQKISSGKARELIQQKHLLNEELHARNEKINELKSRVDRDQQLSWKRKHALRDRFHRFICCFETFDRLKPQCLGDSEYAFLEGAKPSSENFTPIDNAAFQQLFRRIQTKIHEIRQQHRLRINADRDRIAQLAAQSTQLQHDNAALEENGKLELENIERERDDQTRLTLETKLTLQKYQKKMAVARDRHKETSAENTQKREELAALEQKYAQKKNELIVLYEEQMTMVVEVLDKIYVYMEELNEEANLMREVGEELRASDAAALELINAIKALK